MNFSKVQFILPRTLFDLYNNWSCSCKKKVDWNCPCLKASNKSKMVVVSSNDKNQDIPPLCSCYKINPNCKRHQVFLGGSCFQRFFNIDFRGCLNGTIVNAVLDTQFDEDQLIHGIEDEIKMFVASLCLPATNENKQWSNKIRTSELNPKIIFGQQLQMHNAQLAPFALFGSIDFKNHVQFQIRSDGRQVAYRLVDDDKSIQQKKASQYIKNPQTMSQLIRSMARNPPNLSDAGLTVSFDQLQNGDFMVVDKEKMVIEVFDQNKIKQYTDISAPVKNVEIPKMRRLIKDFKLPQLTSKPLKRASEQDYKNIINEWIDKQKAYKLHKQFAKSNWVFVLCAPMGWGKTTRFPFYLQTQIGERLFITLPSIALATAIRDDLTEVARKHFPQKTIGYKIAQVSVDGDIIVQTPGYLTEGVFNFIDEFQFITEFNIDFIEKVSNYKGKTILSSATPFTPLIGCLENAGVHVRRLDVKPLREAKRVIIWGMPKLQPERIPQKGIYYTTMVPKQLKPKDQCFIKSLKQEIKGDLNAIIAHPNYVFGYNPPFELSLGVVDFERVFMTATNYDGVFKMEASMNVQYESVVQAMGRLARMSDSPALLISQRAKHYSSIRFSMPRPPAITANELKFINEAYISRTKSVRHIVSGGDSHLINDLYPVVRRGGKQIVKLGAYEYESAIPLDKNTKSVYALSITGSMFTAFYESTFESRRPNQLNNNLKRLPVFDRSTLREIPEDENMETTPVGSYAIYNITKSGTSVLQVTNAINDNGINGIMLMNVINACGLKPIKSLPGASSLRSILGFFTQKIGLDSDKSYRVKTDCAMTYKELCKVLPNSVKVVSGDIDIVICVKSQALISDLENRITISKNIPEKERYNCYINCVLCKKQQYYLSQPSKTSGTTSHHLAMDRFLWEHVIPEQMKSWVCSDPFYSIPIKNLSQVKQLMTDMRRTSDRATRKHIQMTTEEMSHFIKNASMYTQGMIECFRAGYPLSSEQIIRLAKMISQQSTMLKNILDENISVCFQDVIDGGKDLKCNGELICPVAFHSKLVSIINAKGAYSFNVRETCGHKVATQLKAGVFSLKEEGVFSLACKDITSNVTNVIKVLATSHIEEYSYDFGTKEFLFKAKSNGITEELQDVNDIESKKFYKWSTKSTTHIMLIANPMPTHKYFEVDEIVYEYRWSEQPTLLQYTRSILITQKMLGAKDQIAKLLNMSPDFFTKKTHVYLESTQSVCRYYFFNVRKQCDCQLEMNQFQFEINMLLANNCYKCFNYEQHCTEKATKVNNIIDIFKDLWLLIKHRSFFGEQRTKSKLASKIKLFIERKEDLQEIRKMIHLGDEKQLQLHRRFNLHCSEIGVKPADIWLIIGLCLAGGIIGIGTVVALKLRDMQDHYEDVIRQDMCYNTKTAPLMTNTPNVVEQTQNAGLGFLTSTPEHVVRRVMRSENKNVFRDLFVQNPANILFDRNNQIKQSKVSLRGDAGHKICGQARELASLRLQECITQPFIEFGTRKNDYIDQPCVMVSNRFDQNFKCIREDESLGVYASINSDFMKYFPSTIAQWAQQHRPKYLLIRDSLHSPHMLQNALMCAAKYNLTIYIVNHLPITDCDTSSRSLTDMSYTINRSGIKGWCRLYSHINGQREFSELVPTYEQIQRIALAKRFVAMIHPNRLSDNLVYGLVTITKGDNSTYNKPMMSHNHIGPYTYNEKGELGKVLNAFEQNLIKHATRAQTIKMLSDDRSLITVAPPKTRSIEIGHQLSFGGRVKRWIFGQRTVNEYNNPSFLQCWTRHSTMLTRARVFLANPVRTHGHETVDVTHRNCGLKYALLQSNHNNGRFNSDAWGSKQSGDFPNGYRRGNHATFIGENGAVLNADQPSVEVNGRSFKVQRIINKQKQLNLNYDIVAFNVVKVFKAPQYKYIMYGPLSKAPKSLHISQQKYAAMIEKGWNRTVLPSFTYWLGGRKYSLPDLPTYEDLVNFCTCSLKKTPLIKAQDSNSMNYIEIKNCETCPINTLFSVLGRQCCARKNIELDMAQQFEYFSDWVITSITKKMKDDGFKIDFSSEQVQEYINHVREKDPWKGDKIKENFWKQIKVSDQFNLFVKIGQNHVVQFDPVSQQCSTDDVDPRLIAAPSFAIRGRVGLIAYQCLKWLKKQFPEFMLAKSPQELQQYVLSMRTKPHTSQSDWSKYDATQHKFLRACVDMTFFEQLYHQELIDDPLNQADRFFASVLSARFHSNIKAKNEKCVFRCQGLFEGTTFSGHPTCTSCGGTLRNFLYNLFGFWLERERISFANQIRGLQHNPFRCAGGVIRMFPDFFRFMEIFRLFVGLWVCGDDTGRVARLKRDIQVWQQGMDRISSNNHDPGTHGLGLVIKAPKTDYKRIGILSKIFCLKDQTPIILRQIPRMILTNTSCSPSLTPSDCHYLAAMSFLSGSKDPLSLKLAQLRLSMVKGYIHEGNVFRNFLEQRAHKMLGHRQYTSMQCAFAYGMSQLQYVALVGSISIKDNCFSINFDYLGRKKLKSCTYGYGVASNLLVKSEILYQQDPITLELFKSPNNQLMTVAQQKATFTPIIRLTNLSKTVDILTRMSKDAPSKMKGFLKHVSSSSDKQSQNTDIKSKLLGFMGVRMKQNMLDLSTNYPLTLDIKAMLAQNGIERRPGPVFMQDDQDEVA